MDIKEQLEYLTTSCSEILPVGAEELQKKLASKKRLRVKLGIDPTSPDLHLGHTVCLQLLRKFQELGHIPVLLIGGFTAQLGDPTGRNETRPPLSPEDVKNNSETYLQQVSKILDLSRVEIVNNADWLSSLSLKEILGLLSKTTVNQMISKEAFGQRIDAGQPLFMHELIYPILQGYDSVHLKADIELGGQDQRFNVLMGRDLQRYFAQESQIVMLTPLLVGLDGVKKMSKSYGNYIGISESPQDIYGKTMSLPDELMLSWFQLLTPYTHQQLKDLDQRIKNGENPRNIKMELARVLVQIYHSVEDSHKAEGDFIQRFQKREIPEDLETISLTMFSADTFLTKVLQQIGATSSGGEAKRKIQEGAVKINGVKIESIDLTLAGVKEGDILQLGKRFFRKFVK